MPLRRRFGFTFVGAWLVEDADELVWMPTGSLRPTTATTPLPNGSRSTPTQRSGSSRPSASGCAKSSTPVESPPVAARCHRVGLDTSPWVVSTFYAGPTRRWPPAVAAGCRDRRERQRCTVSRHHGAPSTPPATSVPQCRSVRGDWSWTSVFLWRRSGCRRSQVEVRRVVPSGPGHDLREAHALCAVAFTIVEKDPPRDNRRRRLSPASLTATPRT